MSLTLQQHMVQHLRAQKSHLQALLVSTNMLLDLIEPEPEPEIAVIGDEADAQQCCADDYFSHPKGRLLNMSSFGGEDTQMCSLCSRRYTNQVLQSPGGS